MSSFDRRDTSLAKIIKFSISILPLVQLMRNEQRYTFVCSLTALYLAELLSNALQNKTVKK